jgi:hypothetical protein
MVSAEQSTTLDDGSQDEIRISRLNGPDARLNCPEDPMGQALRDYITEHRPGKMTDSSLAGRACQAWFKLTTHGAFVTINNGLET